MGKKNHLPEVGVGPLIVFPQWAATVIAIVATERGALPRFTLPYSRIPLGLLGAALIVLGVWLWVSANKQAKIFECNKENKLQTEGVYAVVRNPIYSGTLLICTGLILIESNLVLLGIPVLCWAYMSLLLIFSEEKWLAGLYGEEYAAYCKRVNRCIPWRRKKSA